MDLELRGKRALVTGSTAGIGLAIAIQLAADGARVVVNGRTQKRVDDSVASVQKSSPNAEVTGIAADLGTRAGADTMVAQLPDVDILVNNLGIFEAKAFADIPDEDWLHMFEVNVMSGVRLSRHYLPKMLQRDWGRIVFISSESAVQIPGEMIHYGMTKTAQVAVARGLAETCGGTNVTVNSILAGPTKSEGVVQFINALAKEEEMTPEEVEKRFFENMRPSSIIKRFAEPAEVANMVAYVCSPRASATTGAALRVEGGVLRSIF
jgi:NAD(P)-dependent dehydrogenase (short-subunit alcohol dehydrogenase family)